MIKDPKRGKGKGNLTGVLKNRYLWIVVILIAVSVSLYSIIKDFQDRQYKNYGGLPEYDESIDYPRSDLDMEYLFRDETYNFKAYDDGTVTSKRGIDVSEHQGYIDWAEVKASGVEFAFIRAGYRTYNYGNIIQDAYFHYNIESALANGIEVGLYFFSQAVDVDEAMDEASFVCKLAEGYDVTLPIAFDMEDTGEEGTRIDNLTSDQITEITDAFCAVVENYGYRPIIYLNPEWVRGKINLSPLNNRRIWLANYVSHTTFPFRFDFWQYTDSGKISGINVPVDLDIMFVRSE